MTIRTTLLALGIAVALPVGAVGQTRPTPPPKDMHDFATCVATLQSAATTNLGAALKIESSPTTRIVQLSANRWFVCDRDHPERNGVGPAPITTR